MLFVYCIKQFDKSYLILDADLDPAGCGHAGYNPEW